MGRRQSRERVTAIKGEGMDTSRSSTLQYFSRGEELLPSGKQRRIGRRKKVTSIRRRGERGKRDEIDTSGGEVDPCFSKGNIKSTKRPL